MPPRAAAVLAPHFLPMERVAEYANAPAVTSQTAVGLPINGAAWETSRGIQNTPRESDVLSNAKRFTVSDILAAHLTCPVLRRSPPDRSPSRRLERLSSVSAALRVVTPSLQRFRRTANLEIYDRVSYP